MVALHEANLHYTLEVIPGISVVVLRKYCAIWGEEGDSVFSVSFNNVIFGRKGCWFGPVFAVLKS